MEQVDALRCLERLASAFDADPSDARVMVYLERLVELDADLVRRAVETAIDECRYFPSWAELRTIIEDTKADQRYAVAGALPERATWTEEDELAAKRAMRAALATWRARRSGHPAGEDAPADEA